jgi:sigma-E factor negative regulatory protein RseB
VGTSDSCRLRVCLTSPAIQLAGADSCHQVAQPPLWVVVMIWLYWRRVRLVVLEVAIGLTAIVALSALVISLGGGGVSIPRETRLPQAIPLRRYVIPQPDAAIVRRGIVLLSDAASACQTVSYHGVQMVAWAGSGGMVSYLIEVWHKSGQPELAEGDNDNDDRIPGTDASNDTAIGVLSISPRMLNLLRANYLIKYAGTGSSSNRPALIVAVWRHDGTLAARYWLDQVTGLPLRREMYDSRGRLVSEGAFVDLQIGDRDVGLVPDARAPEWSAQPTARSLSGLRHHGWIVPGVLAGNMALVGLTKTATSSGSVLDASYSDGLSVVSLFIQRGELPAALPGWHTVRLSGHAVDLTENSGVGERGLAWSAGGFVYTVIADAPPDTVDQVVGQLPHDQNVGIWGRMTEGLKRIASWFDPFG